MGAAVKRRTPVGELLVAAGRLTREQLELALTTQRKWAGRLGELLVASRAVTEAHLASAIAAQAARPFMPDERLFALEPDPKLLRLFPRDRAQQLQVLPLVERDRVVWVASSEPETPERTDAVRFALGCSGVRWMVVTPTALRSAMNWAYRRC